MRSSRYDTFVGNLFMRSSSQEKMFFDLKVSNTEASTATLHPEKLVTC